MRMGLWIGSGALALLLGILAFRPAPGPKTADTPKSVSNPVPRQPAAPMPPVPPQERTSPPPPKTFEELSQEAADLELPAPPPEDADEKAVREYARSLGDLARGTDAERARKIHDFQRSFMRERSRLRSERHRAEMDRHREERRREHEARMAEMERLHPRPPEDPNRPKPEPLIPPPELGPPVTGVERPEDK